MKFDITCNCVMLLIIMLILISIAYFYLNGRKKDCNCNYKGLNVLHVGQDKQTLFKSLEPP